VNAPLPIDVERAGGVSRLAAFVVDAAILALIVQTTAWLLGATARMLGRFAPPVDLRTMLLAVAPLIVALYQVAFWVARGQTPGKWLLGIRIVPIEGGRLTIGRALLRFFGYLISALPCYLGFVWMLGPQRRAWHDRLARTEVTYVRRPRPENTRATELRQRIRTIEQAHPPRPLPEGHGPG
jgi:uncharacterized RDD family membrane protein YckC